MNLADVADELYGLPPEDFVAARDDRRKQVRGDGDRALADEIGKLPRPSTAAWVLDMLVRREPGEMQQLVELGASLRAAQRELAGDQLRELSRQRSRLVTALTSQARALAHDLGRPVSDAIATQIEETLRAAITDEDAGRAVLSGRLVSPLHSEGTGSVDIGGAVAVSSETTAPPRSRASKRTRSSTAETQRRARQRELADARAGLEGAETAADHAGTEVAVAQDRVDDLGAERDGARARIAELQRQLDDAENRAGELTGEIRSARRQRDAAERRAHRAENTRDRARARMQRLKAVDGGVAD